MKHNNRTGKFIRRRRLGWTVIPLCIGVGILAWLLLSSLSAQRDFQALADQVHSAAQAAQAAAATDPAAADPADASTDPTSETEPQILPQFQALYQENPDFFGWISIPDTIIDYPVMHTPDEPNKYLRANFYGVYSRAGVPFVRWNCTLDSDNIIIYGHNMVSDGSMFHTLLSYQDEAFWADHPIIHFDTLYEEQEYEVLAVFFDRVYSEYDTGFKFYQFIDAEDAADFDTAIAYYRKNQLYDTGVTAAYGDQLITLVTCSYHTDNGRFVVVARKK